MKKKTKNTIMALTGAGALASFVVGVAPELKGSQTEPDSTNAYLGGDVRSGPQQQDPRTKGDKGDRSDRGDRGDNDGKESKKFKQVKKVKKVRSPKKFIA